MEQVVVHIHTSRSSSAHRPQKDPFKEGEIWREEIESRTIKDEM